MTNPTPIKSHRDLDVWQRSMALAVAIYPLTAEFPKSELYGLTSQMRRASVSVPSNIAEGHNRRGRDFPRFLAYSLGSLAELETQLEIARSIGYSSDVQHAPLADECDQLGKMLRVLQQKLLGVRM